MEYSFEKKEKKEKVNEGLDQEEIKEMLKEAVKKFKEKETEAFLNVQKRLEEALMGRMMKGKNVDGYNEGQKKWEERRGVLDTLMKKLFTDTLENKAELLPNLLPVFILLAGKGDENEGLVGDMFGKVDWDKL